jgi:Type II secretion system (T2SS), protein G
VTERYNSQRTLARATYVPTKLPAQPAGGGDGPGQGPAILSRVMPKVAFIRGLNLRPAELQALQDTPELLALNPGSTGSELAAPSAAKPSAQGVDRQSLLDLVKTVATDLSSELMRTQGQLLRAATPEDLAAIGQAVQQFRAGVATDISTLLHRIRLAYAKSRQVKPETVRLPDALNWAQQSDQADLQRLLRAIQASTPTSVTFPTSEQLLARLQALLREASATQTLIDDLLLSFQFEPVGRIHLERMEMTPVGIEHGELVYSVPLTPKETVNLTHREWSQTTTTFESLVQDYFEGYSEQGVAEKTDIATSSSAQTKHSSSFDANASVNFSYDGNPYSLTTSAAVDYKTSAEDDNSVKDSRAHSMAITRTASARTRKDHKQSFRVASVAETENLAVRVLTNPSATDAMRVDYFRLMRKWRVDLIRYGLRMTYDLVVPNPGNALASKVREIEDLNRVLNTEFKFDVALANVTPATYRDLATQYGADIEPPLWPTPLAVASPLQPSGDTPAYQVVEAALPDGYQIAGGRLDLGFVSKDKEPGMLVEDLPDPKSGTPVQPNDKTWIYGDNPVESLYKGDPSGWNGAFNCDLSDPNKQFAWIGRSGKLAFHCFYYNVNTGSLRLQLDLKPLQSTMDAWQLKAWTTLRTAALDRWNEGMQRLHDRKAQLEQEIAANDSLTLRRMEREEIMRLVLQWLFGPSFQFVPTMFELLGLVESFKPSPDPLPEEYLDPTQMTLVEWDSVRKYGEFIKYIQNAVEWENLLFFSYPYFWDLIENWPFKRFLVHPDFDHRTFLRAGCARVVLPIRPGFECSFARLVEHFTLPKNQVSEDDDGSGDDDPCKELGKDHPYVTIGEETRNYAMTNYEHIPPANPDNNVRPLLYPLQRRAWSDMQKVMAALDQYDQDAHDPNKGGDPNLDPTVHKYPAKLADLPGWASLPPADPWGREWVYKTPGDHGDYDLASYGKNGKQSDPTVPLDNELDADITSWAEGNVVGRWYEYTPTGALDVAVNMVLPTTPAPA